MRPLTVFLLLGLAGSSILASTIHVPMQQLTIQSGIDAASNSDTVLVAPGLYVENIDLRGKAVRLVAAGGLPGVTIRSATGFRACIICTSGEDTMTVIDGFRLDGNSNSRGVYCSESSPVVQNCEIFNCGGFGDGGGIYCYNSSALIRRNKIHDNTAPATGAGICLLGGSAPGVEISCNEIYNSLGAGEAIGCLSVNQVYIHHNVLRNNTMIFWAACGVYMNGGTNVRIINNSIVDNTHGIVTFGSPEPIVRNNIIVGSTEAALPSYLTQSDYNNVFNNGSNNLPGPNGISADPLFSDAASHDYSLREGSPCIDAGDPSPQYNDSDGTRNDIGASPKSVPLTQPFAANLTVLPSNPDGSVSSLTPQFTWDFRDTTGTTQASYWIQLGDDPDWSTPERWDTGPVASSANAVTYGGIDLQDRRTYWLRVRVNNGLGWGDWNQLSFWIRASGLLHVPSQYLTIQSAINAALPGDTVLVASGAYTENINLSRKQIVLTSEYGSTGTTIRAAYSGTAVITCNLNEDTTTVIDGFTIDGSGGGRGILCDGASPIIQHCEIRNCGNVTDGAGIYCLNSSSKIRSNTVHDNSAGGTGSGICVRGTAAPGAEIAYNEIYNSLGTGEAIGCLYVGGVFIHHNLLRDNTVNYWPASGVYLNGGSNIRIINNTIVHNTHGIVTYDNPQPVVLNNIIAGSLAEAVPFGLTQCDYNDVWGNGSNNLPGPNGLSVDPSFANPGGNLYTLQANSPCLDAGHPDPQYNDADGSRGDMGAFPGVTQDPYILQVEILNEDRSHVLSLTPHLSWRFSTMGAQAQDSFEIAVGTNNEWSVAEMWSPGVIASGDTSIVYGGSMLSKGGTYYYRLRIHDGLDWSRWSSGSFHVNRAPSVPTPYKPSSDKVYSQLDVLGVNNATDFEQDTIRYSAEIYADSLLTQLVSAVDNVFQQIPLTWMNLYTELPDNNHYVWRARAFDGYEYSDWSAIASFWVNFAPDPPFAPMLTSPPTPDSLPVFTLLPTMQWQPAVDPDPFDSLLYKFELSNQSSFALVFAKDSLSSTSYTITDSLSFGTHYWWRVTVQDKTGLTATSQASDFWTWRLGDINHSHVVDLSDLSIMVSYLTQPNVVIQPRFVADVTGDCRIDISDLSYMVGFLTVGNAVFKAGCE